jgi:branched-chain amino acid aminotransferase
LRAARILKALAFYNVATGEIKGGLEPMQISSHVSRTPPASLEDRDGKIWMDGRLIEWRSAKIHVLTHTLHYGYGVFEGVRAYKQDDGSSAIFRLQDHTRRLMNSAKLLRIALPYTQQQLDEAQKEVVRANQLGSCYLRPLVWLGSESLGVSAHANKVHAMVAAWVWGAYQGEEGLSKGISIKTSSFARAHINTFMSQAKAVSNYTNSILANMEATLDGYDEALLLDTAGFVSEGSGENFFLVREGVIYTPDLSAGALNGITRNTVLHIAKDLGIDVVQKRITRDEAYVADEAFFSGTAAEITPVRALDRIQIGEGTRGVITQKIQSAFFDIVHGRDPRYAHWLERV